MATIYRGTQLTEAINILQHNYPSKPLYRITDKQESLDYALTHKTRDPRGQGAVVQSQLDLSANVPTQILSIAQWQDIHRHPERINPEAVSIFSTSLFQVYIIPLLFSRSLLKQQAIVEIV